MPRNKKPDGRRVPAMAALATAAAITSGNSQVCSASKLTFAILLLAIVIGASFMAGWMVMWTSSSSPFMSDVNEMFVSDTAKYELVYLHMTGCPHCVRFTPVWRSFETTYARELSNLNVVVADHEARSEGAKSYGATSFPTVMLVSKTTGAVTEFTGDRTEQALMEFVRKHAT